MNKELYRVQLAIRGQESPVKNKEELINTIRKNSGNPVTTGTGYVYLTDEDFYLVTNNISQRFESDKNCGQEPSIFVIRRVNRVK